MAASIYARTSLAPSTNTASLLLQFATLKELNLADIVLLNISHSNCFRLIPSAIPLIVIYNSLYNVCLINQNFEPPITLGLWFVVGMIWSTAIIVLPDGFTPALTTHACQDPRKSCDAFGHLPPCRKPSLNFLNDSMS